MLAPKLTEQRPRIHGHKKIRYVLRATKQRLVLTYFTEITNDQVEGAKEWLEHCFHCNKRVIALIEKECVVDELDVLFHGEALLLTATCRCWCVEARIAWVEKAAVFQTQNIFESEFHLKGWRKLNKQYKTHIYIQHIKALIFFFSCCPQKLNDLLKRSMEFYFILCLTLFDFILSDTGIRSALDSNGTWLVLAILVIVHCLEVLLIQLAKLFLSMNWSL